MPKLLVLVLILFAPAAFAQIPKPGDAPQPLSPEDSARQFSVPSGFRVELVASEPLIREPSGVCWDDRGRLFVCELHGYNLEGQLEVEELNQAGKLDRVVRRLQAHQRHKQAAAKETYGTIKLLRDNDGDGRMDQATVWADRLPPCLGICPARGGIIAACHTKILFLADRDGDDRAEVREVLFAGFKEAPLERSINSPQWGPDNWIYLGSSAGGGTIRGKYLDQPVAIPNTDVRMRPDGSAIEAVTGRTHTMGFSFTEAGDRFVISTRTPGIFVAPIAWRYLARNPNVAVPPLEESATSDTRAWPTSQPHPWRSRRAADPGFAKFYSDRYGVQESAPNGYFTSACSPLVYRDTALPGMNGQLLACEPAQNLVHRGIVQRDGLRLRLQRADDEQQAEFLTSSDPWFHAISLAHAPDGSVYLVDFYREIIEDYSAIPRYLQQQYGLVAGENHGRIWRLTHDQATQVAVSSDMSRLSPEELAGELASPRFWRRQTARRLLLENDNRDAKSIENHIHIASDEATTLNALSVLQGWETLQPEVILTALQHGEPSVRRRALQLAEPWLRQRPVDQEIFDRVLALVSDESPIVRLQLALSLGEIQDDRSLKALVRLSHADADERWMSAAILSSVSQNGGRLFEKLLESPDRWDKLTGLIKPLCSAIANRRDREELSQTLIGIEELRRPVQQVVCLSGIRESFQEVADVTLSDTARQSIKTLAHHPDTRVREEARPLVTLMKIETAEERHARLTAAVKDLTDVRLSSERRIRAVEDLADDPEIATTDALLIALPSSTPHLREAILAEVFRREHGLSKLLDAIESKYVPAAWLDAVMRATLLEAADDQLRGRATQLLAVGRSSNDQQYQRYVSALANARDVTQGERVFRETCSKCHRAHGIGHTVGPDLNAEFLRAEETIIRDVLSPHEKIAAGYGTYAVVTVSGRVITGLLVSESPTSITLRQVQDKEQTILRKDVEELRAMAVSMMPEDLVKTVTPQQLADTLAWMRRPPTRLVLLDENSDLISSLSEGSGTVEFINSDRHSGRICLRVTPPQRHSPRIPDWHFPIREKPGVGEYRYLRFAWKSPENAGVMIELAADGNWPPAEKPLRRYHAGRNTTGWASVSISESGPHHWTVVTRDLWKDFGEFTLTGIAPTAMGGAALFDCIELLQVVGHKEDSHQYLK